MVIQVTNNLHVIAMKDHQAVNSMTGSNLCVPVSTAPAGIAEVLSVKASARTHDQCRMLVLAIGSGPLNQVEQIGVRLLIFLATLIHFVDYFLHLRHDRVALRGVVQ